MRFPFAPLEALARVQVHEPTDDRVAEALGTSRRQMYRWREIGVDEARADVLAHRLDLHPAEVWPEWVQDPKQRKAEYQRAYRKRPAAAEANRAQRRAYYEANRVYELARQARYDAVRRSSPDVSHASRTMVA